MFGNVSGINLFTSGLVTQNSKIIQNGYSLTNILFYSTTRQPILYNIVPHSHYLIVTYSITEYVRIAPQCISPYPEHIE